MSDNKKYYYIRLKESFFDSDEIKMLESIPNDGYKFSNILLKMYLKSLKYDGRLMFNEGIPFNSEMLSVVTGHSLGDVERAIELFKKFGLIEVFDTGEIYMLDIQTMIGKSSTEADRIKAYRNKIEKKKLDGVQMYDKRTPEIEIEKELEIDKELDNTPLPPTGERPKSYKSKSSKLTEQEKADFEALWKLYPKKSGKNPAEKSYLKAIRSGVTNKQIQNGIVAYNQKIKAEEIDMQFVKMGSTWFNQQAWDDDYTISVPKNSYGRQVKVEPQITKNEDIQQEVTEEPSVTTKELMKMLGGRKTRS